MLKLIEGIARVYLLMLLFAAIVVVVGGVVFSADVATKNEAASNVQSTKHTP